MTDFTRWLAWLYRSTV